MRLRNTIVLAICLGLSASLAQEPGFPKSGDPADIKLPNGKSQREEILKAEHKKSVSDAETMERLASEVQDELSKGAADVVNLKTIKKLEEIEKLAKNIHGRLKRI
jgi:hypothetical protein